MNLTDELDLCDDGNILSNKDKLLKIGKLLWVETKTCNDIPNKGYNILDREKVIICQYFYWPRLIQDIREYSAVVILASLKKVK